MASGSALEKALKLLNVIPQDIAWAKGYLNSNGVLLTANQVNKEVTSDYTSIPFSQGEKYLFFQRFYGAKPSSDNGWVAICYWDSTNVFRVRSMPSVAGVIESTDEWYQMYAVYSPPYTDGTIRWSLRTFGECDLYCIPYTQATKLFVDTGIATNIKFDSLA